VKNVLLLLLLLFEIGFRPDEQQTGLDRAPTTRPPPPPPSPPPLPPLMLRQF
jgi:hypothetical protein